MFKPGLQLGHVWPYDLPCFFPLFYSVFSPLGTFDPMIYLFDPMIYHVWPYDLPFFKNLQK